jgi:hypothetical protein
MTLTKPLPDSIDGGTDGYGSPSTNTSTSDSNSGDEDEDDDFVALPLTPSQKIFVAHGVLLTLAFMVILPLGALQARLFRTIVPGKWWFMAHWILQWPFSSILIIVGFALGVNEVSRLKSGHLNDTHKVWTDLVLRKLKDGG